MKKLYETVYRWLTWATVKEACSPKGEIAWYKKLARRWLPVPSSYSDRPTTLMPKRIQRKRTKGWKIPEGAVYVGRPTRYGNPWRIRHIGRFGKMLGAYWLVQDTKRNWYPSSQRVAQRFAVWRFRQWARDSFGRRFLRLDELRGKDLVCWCRPDQPCHADILLELANSDPAGGNNLQSGGMQQDLDLWRELASLMQRCLDRKFSVEIVRCGQYALPGKPYLCRVSCGMGTASQEHLVYGDDAPAIMRDAMTHVLERGFTETYDYGL